jgi:parallel beta-helix repeat protein
MKILMLLIFPLSSVSNIYEIETDLSDAIKKASNGDTLVLKPGRYKAEATPYFENICGNCVEPVTTVEATVGFHIYGKSLTIIGKSRDETILVTNAGYGVLFEESGNSYIGNLTITGGLRDPDGNATDAAIVVKKSRVIVENVKIVDNTSRVEDVVVGIGGIFGREGAEIIILNNLIENNGWDGIALYRGSTAYIADNIIRDGRGAGIGITWDATAIILRNRISGYWKGIGSFGTSRVIVRNNAVFDNLGWGIIATDSSYMEVVNNVIYHNGNCGFAVWEKAVRGILKNNIIVLNGWKREWVCPGVGVWMNTPLENFPILYNNVWGNVAGNYRGVDDLTGVKGNISEDPLFNENFELKENSPCIDKGDPALIDVDGSRSDMGIYGGPQAHQYANFE